MGQTLWVGPKIVAEIGEKIDEVFLENMKNYALRESGAVKACPRCDSGIRIIVAI